MATAYCFDVFLQGRNKRKEIDIEIKELNICLFVFYVINRRRQPECPCDREKIDKDKVPTVLVIFHPRLFIYLGPDKLIND